MNTRELIENKVKEEGLELGCYNDMINKLPKKMVAKIIDSITGDSGDIGVTYRKKKFVIEMMAVDNELDFYMTPLAEYVSLCGEDSLEYLEF